MADVFTTNGTAVFPIKKLPSSAEASEVIGYPVTIGRLHNYVYVRPKVLPEDESLKAFTYAPTYEQARDHWIANCLPLLRGDDDA